MSRKSNENLNPLPQISATAYILGIISGISFTLIFTQTFQNFIYLPIYLCFISIFHFLEYFITASYQPDRVCIDSYVINNGHTYHFAHLFALVECLLELYFFPNFKTSNYFLLIKLFGFLMTIFGQFIRSLAMKTAGANFSHVIQNVKSNNHILIKHGIYSYSRHPSYFGFFYWALGTQLLLLNPLSIILFFFLLYRFFSDRITYEEKTLISFFGDDYLNYKNSVPVGIPFIS